MITKSVLCAWMTTRVLPGDSTPISTTWNFMYVDDIPVQLIVDTQVDLDWASMWGDNATDSRITFGLWLHCKDIFRWSPSKLITSWLSLDGTRYSWRRNCFGSWWQILYNGLQPWVRNVHLQQDLNVSVTAAAILTTWGYQDTQRDPNNGSFGGACKNDDVILTLTFHWRSSYTQCPNFWCVICLVTILS